jgi:hypothetical protein
LTGGAIITVIHLALSIVKTIPSASGEILVFIVEAGLPVKAQITF